MLDLPRLDDLPRQNASRVKNKWGEVARQVQQSGSVAITNHSTVEMVLLDAATYERLVREVAALKSREQAELDALAERFDERLLSLQQADAAERVASLFERRWQLGKRPVAGDSY